MTDITNEQRAGWAAHGVLQYATGKEGGEELYEDPETVLTDLLCDLRHYADRESIDFKTCLDRAETHYDAEIEEDPVSRLARALGEAIAALRRIADITHYENGEPVTALESRDIETIYADAAGQLEDFETTLKTARRYE